jgi:dienelactone hydrolase
MKKLFAFVLFIALLLFNLSSAFAQQIPFLGELPSRYEEFNRLYKEKQRAGANVAAIDALRRRGEEAFKRFDIPAIIETESEAIALLQGKQWNERQRFISSLTMETDRLVIEPNRELQVSLIRMFPVNIEKAFPQLPVVTFELIAQKPASSDSPFAKPQTIAQQAIAETSTNAARRLPLPDGAYWIIARVEAGGQKVAEIKRAVYAISDFSDSIAQMKKTVAEIKSSSDEKVKAVSHLVATPEFKLARLSQLNRARPETEIDALTELDRINELLGALAKGRNPFAGERGELERAYNATDGALVPYRVYVPKSYDGTTARPLVVMLHGAFGDEGYYFSGLFDPEVVKGEAERRGWILVGTNGRGRFPRYDQMGLRDAFESINAVTRDYKIDSSRIYLTGHSMGAGGAWIIAASKPDMFAAIAPVSGVPITQADAFAALLEKIKHVPVVIAHGGRDQITLPQNSRDAVAIAQKAGLRVTHLEISEADHLSALALSFPAILDFFDKTLKPGGQ